jgi:hypothetical protein
MEIPRQQRIDGINGLGRRQFALARAVSMSE